MKNCIFSTVSERDMDFLIIEEFACSQEFADIFLSKVELQGSNVVEIIHSRTDAEYGESDITVIVEHNNLKRALLIEDKIDANAMPNQSGRYTLRGDKAVKNGDYDGFDVFITAPQEYVDGNDEAKKYAHCVFYEEILTYFSKYNDARNDFKMQLINQAIIRQKSPYQVVENIVVSDFWDKYINYQITNHPDLWLVSKPGKKGSRAKWAQYNTHIKGIVIYHKADVGKIDLSFNGAAKNYISLEKELIRELGNLEQQNSSLHIAGESVALRLYCPKIDLSKPFELQQENIKKSFCKIRELFDISKRLDDYVIKQLIS